MPARLPEQSRHAGFQLTTAGRAGGWEEASRMRARRTVLGCLALMGTVAGALVAGDAARAEEKLVTSGVELVPVLIGTRVEGSDVKLEGNETYDGPLNVVIDSPYQIWAAMGSYIHVAAFDPSFKPATGARVFLDGKLIGRADEHGTFVFADATNKDMSYSNSHSVDVVYDKGSKRYRGSVYFNSFPRTQGFESAHIFVYTDRGVYNPGQTIRIRTVAWSLTDDFAALDHESVDLLLEDEAGRVVAGGAVETDEYGIATLDIPLPEHAPEGRYTLKANFDRESASARLRVERFVPPVIDIQHDLGRFLTRDQKSLPVKITLGMFGGGEFTEGTLKLVVTAGGKVRFEATKKVSGKGPHDVLIDEKALAKVTDGLAEDENVRVTIEVTDEYGRRDEIKRDMRFTSNPYRVVVEMDKDQYAEGDTVRAMVRVVDLDEVPIREKKVKLVVEDKTYHAETDDGGIAKFELPMGKISLTGQVYIEGVDASLATMYATYYPPRPMTSEIPEGVVKEKADTEIVIRFPTEFVPVESVVHADIVDQSGALIGAALIPIGKEKGKWMGRGTFPAPAWGSMLLTMFCLGKSGDGAVGLLTEGQNLPVQANRTLEIAMTGLAHEAGPGDTLSVTATVKGPDGKPATAAVGASIVDQAVLGMLDPLEITPMDRFFHPQLKVLSSAGSKILTWPVVSRNWGYATHDIALPPFGFREGGANTQANQYGAAKNDGIATTENGGKKGKTGSKKDKAKAKKEKIAGKIEKPSTEYSEAESDYDNMYDSLAGGEEGQTFGWGGLGLSGTGMGGGGTAESSIGIGSYGAVMGSAAVTKSASSPVIVNADMEKLVQPSSDAFSGAAMDEASAALSMGAGASLSSKPSVRIVVRTNFAETSLWAPDLVAKDGKLSFEARLSDSITTQTVTLVASDEKGRVGMVREKVDVSQDLYSRSDLPATLTLGDAVEVTSAVRNFTDKPVKATLGLSSDGLAIVGPSQQSVNVPVSGTATATFQVKPLRAGEVSYEVWTEGGGVKDVQRRTLWVHPAGLPTVITATGDTKRDDPFVAEVHLSGKDTHVSAMLNVSFPNAVPVLQGIESMVDQPGGAIDYISSNALVTAMAYRYLLAAGKNESALAMLELRMQAAMAGLLMSQNADGGWGWHVCLLRSETSGKPVVDVPVSNPYMTAQSLEGLVEIHRAGLPVPESAVRAALLQLASSLGSDGLWSVKDIAFWEGETNEVQLGISAEIFRVMADACLEYPILAAEASIDASMGKLAKSLRPLLTDPMMRDPMALSHAALGVWKWAKVKGSADAALDKELRTAAGTLVNLRDEAYWEPSWFNAFGGTLEATAAAMELLVTLDPEAFELELRQCLEYVLSTQESFGAWHNARGTAAAVRALLLVPPTKPEVASKVEISVNGKLVEAVDIDPDDPFMSAVSLRMIELTPYLAKGDNEVEVTYTGNLVAPVKLTLTRWGIAQPEGAAMPGAPDVKVKRVVTDLSDGQGALVSVTLKVRFAGGAVPVVLTEPFPSNATPEAASLDALVSDGSILGYDLHPDEVLLFPAPGADKITLTYRLEGQREGKAVQGGTRVAPLADPSLVVSGNTTTLVVK